MENSNSTDNPPSPLEDSDTPISDEESRRGLIGYFANNSVAANLLMIFIIVMGFVTFFTMQRQMFPNIEINKIVVQIAYPGASPQEIEEGIVVKVEESLKDVTEIEKVVSRAFQNSGRVVLEIDPEKDLAQVMDKVKLRVDGIATLPADMEPLVVYQQEFQQNAVEMSLYGDYSLSQLKPIAKQIEDELLSLGNVSLVNVFVPDDEIAVEVDPEVLRKYNLSINDVAEAIDNYSANISAGQVRTASGLVSIRVENQYYSGQEFATIPVIVGELGEKVLLGEIATIVDEFVEGESYFNFNGKNAVYIIVNATKDQDLNTVVDTVKLWHEARQKTLPPGMGLDIVVDFTFYLDARLNMMLKNLFFGAILVAIVLGLFLRMKLAFWVMIGLPVCFLGAMMMMPVLGVTINIISLFAFIMVLGIVVDDAIVIGESVYTEIEKKGGGVKNVVVGARRVASPATFGVLTTIAFFVPFTLATGPDAPFFTGVAIVAILCLIFSLIESKLILPAHLAHATFKPKPTKGWRYSFNQSYHRFIDVHYRSFVTRCVQWRWTVLASFMGILLISLGLVAANLVRFVPSPPIPHDFPSIKIEMNDNVSDTAIIDALKVIEDMVNQVEAQVREETGQVMFEKLMAWNEGRTDGQVLVSLVPEEERPLNTFEMSRLWREQMPQIAGAKSIQIFDDLVDDGDGEGDFGYLFFGADLDTLNAAGLEFMRRLSDETGVYDISSTIDPVSKEIQLELKPVAYEMGFTLTNVANQVGASFFGGEAQRIIRSGDELKVMVRYPELTRQNLASLKYTMIKTPAGREVMLGDVVDFVERPGVSYIRRESGYRSVYVWGAIDTQLVEPSAIEEKATDVIIPEIKAMFPGIQTQLGGDIQEQQEQVTEQILFFFAALLVVYLLLAIPLKSYLQPWIVISVIPFSLTGAIWGHLFMGMDLSSMSTFGLVAAAGVVINDSLVMTHYINGVRARGVAIKQAVIDAGCARFRAITLTSITTFAGVAPIMFEKSMQALLVVPMAVALGFSVLFATVITLILVPCLYVIFDDAKGVVRKIIGRPQVTTTLSVELEI